MSRIYLALAVACVAVLWLSEPVSAENPRQVDQAAVAVDPLAVRAPTPTPDDVAARLTDSQVDRRRSFIAAEAAVEWRGAAEWARAVTVFVRALDVAAGRVIVCPVPGSTFVDSWGAPRGHGGHKGVDMMAPHGATIYAPASGMLRQTSESFFLTETASGVDFFGTHNSGQLRGDGPVTAGEPIALVGATGNATPGAEHLHFEIQPGGVAVNPYPVTAAACG